MDLEKKMKMERERIGFCTECRAEVPYEVRRVKIKHTTKEKEYTFEVNKAFCKECGAQIEVPGMMDKMVEEIDEQYRKAEDLVSVETINKLMELYNIGKAPLSLALGFGEITITRYINGQMPSKEYSDIVKKALENPKYMMEKLGENREKIGGTAYKKALMAAKNLDSLFCVSEKMLSTISYIFDRIHEVTPLALQKMLYFAQGIYLAIFGKPLFEEDCMAWVHGPVYKPVYDMFKTFKYNPIEDPRFLMFKNRFKELTDDDKKVIDLVVETFGMYSGTALERITHREKPWKEARKGYLPTEHSYEVISKGSIKEYFDGVSGKYDITTAEGVKKYIDDQLKGESDQIRQTV